jgi:GT2 family glycosyltransferase
MTPTATVVTAVYGNSDALHGLLEALGRQQPFRSLIQVVVVDNHQVPRLRDEAPGWKKYGFEVTIVHEPELGLSRARNAGIRAARGQYVLVTDPDSRPHQKWVYELVNALHSTGAFCAGGRTEAMYEPQGIEGTIPGDVMAMFLPQSWPAEVTPLRDPYWLVGCNMAFRNNGDVAYSEHLGVVGRRHLSCEDLEMTFRAQAAGELVVVVPDALVLRAVHDRDLLLRSLIGRHFWHGVSMARVFERYGREYIYDSFDMAHAILRVVNALSRRRRERIFVAGLGAMRVFGFYLERCRLGMIRTKALRW